MSSRVMGYGKSLKGKWGDECVYNILYICKRLSLINKYF